MQNENSQQADWRKRFFAIWIGQHLSWIGSSVAGFALVWWLTEITDSATVLAMGIVITLLPGVFLAPFVGALVDRWNRRRILIVADSVVAFSSAGLAVLFWTGAIQVWHVYVIMFVRALGAAFHWPAMMASTSLMVPEKHLPRVSGLNQAMGGAATVLSPPLGALLLRLLPLHDIMAVDVLTAAFAIVPLFFVSIPQPESPAEAPPAGVGKPRAGNRSLWADVGEGWRYVWSRPGLLAICILAMLLNFALHPALSLLPILVSRHFAGEAMQLGWMNSAWGSGLLLGGLVLGAWGGFRRRVVTMLVGIIGLGAGVLLIGLTPATAFYLAVGGLFFGAAMNALSNGSLFALLQQLVAAEMQGRVLTLVSSLCGATSPLSTAIAGPLVDRFGIRPLYITGSVVQILLGLGGFLVPTIMRMESDWDEHTGKGRTQIETPVPTSADTT